MNGTFRPKRGAPNNNNSRMLKNVAFVSVIVVIGLIFIAATNQAPQVKEIPLTQAVQESNAGQYSKITVNGNELDITNKDEKNVTFKT